MAAAREKAALYCEVAGVALGRVLRIDDVNPDVLVSRQYGHGFRESTPIEDPGDPGRIDPGAIAIGAAVNMVFAIEPIDA